jgi:hypothetical protein
MQKYNLEVLHASECEPEDSEVSQVTRVFEASKLRLSWSHPDHVEGKCVSLQYKILKQLGDGVGIPHVIWFGRVLTFHTLALELLGLSLHDIFKACNRQFSLHTVMNIGDQLVHHFERVVADANIFPSFHTLSTFTHMATFTAISSHKTF